MIKGYKNLDVWKLSIELVLLLYKITKYFPKNEQLGLTSQIRRAIITIPSSVAEGYGRNSTKELIRYLYIAYGSSNELETQITIAFKLNYINKESYDEILDMILRIQKMLNKFISSLKRKLA